MFGQWFGQWFGKWFGYGDIQPVTFEAIAFDYSIEMCTGRKLMEPQTFDKRQGNSLWIKIRCRKWDKIDPTWSTFTGNNNWKVIDSTGATLLSGVITPSATAGDMYLKITPTDTATLAVGSYILVSEVTNTLQTYKEERQDTLNIIGPNSI